MHPWMPGTARSVQGDYGLALEGRSFPETKNRPQTVSPKVSQLPRGF